MKISIENGIFIILSLALTLGYGLAVYLGFSFWGQFINPLKPDWPVPTVYLANPSTYGMWQALAFISFFANFAWGFRRAKTSSINSPYAAPAVLHLLWILLCLFGHLIGVLICFVWIGASL